MRRSLLLAAVLVGCPTAGPDSPPEPTPATSDLTLSEFGANGSGGVGVLTLDLDDPSRVTPASGDEPELPSRRLLVEVWYPAEQGSTTNPSRDAAVAGQGHPLLIWSHGFTSTRLDSPKLAQHLAGHGYVVAAIEFPLSSRNTAGTPDASDVVNQPGDVSFVLDTLLADPAFDTELVAAGGISLGGLTTLMVGLEPAYADPRLDALLPITPATCSLTLDALESRTPPLLLAHGTSDAILPFDDHAQTFWDATTGPRRLATFELGTHTGFADVTEDLLEGLDHADTLGCGQIEDALQGQDPVPAPDGVLNPACPLPCQDMDALPVAMRPSRQGLLTRALAHAFLDAELLGDEAAALWLDAGVGLQHDDITLQAAD